MSQLRLSFQLGCCAAVLAMASAASADSVNISMNGRSTASPVMTVRQEITNFADRYGNPVIVHGALNLDAPVAMAFDQGMSSDQAISALSDAAGAYVVRVYFVSPAPKGTVTTAAYAARLVGDRGDITLELSKVSAQAAIEAVAATDGAEVRFPDGVPGGTVTFHATALPLSVGVARVAALTKTHWSLGYLLQSTNPSLPALSNGYREGDLSQQALASSTSGDSAADWPAGYVVTDLPPLKPLARDAQGNILPITINLPSNRTVASSTSTTGTLTPAQAAAAARNTAALQAQQSQYNSSGINDANMPQSAYDPTVTTFPGNDLFGGPTSADPDYLGSDYGTFQTVIPSGNQSDFRLLPDDY